MRVKYLVDNLLNFFITLVEGFLGLRFILLLLGASSSNSFVSWIYDMSGVLLDPFRGIFPSKVFENTYVFEFATLFAMLVYAVVALLLASLINTTASPVKTNKK